MLRLRPLAPLLLAVVLLAGALAPAYGATPAPLRVSDLITKGPWYDVRAFGAKGDNATLDTAAVQAAFAAAAAKPGAVVLFPPGRTYLVDALAITGADNLTVLGHGAALRLRYNANGHAIEISDSTNVRVEGLRLIGTSDTSALYNETYRHQGIRVLTSSFVTIADCVFEKFSSFGVFATQLTGGTYTEGLLVVGNTFRDFPYDATTPYQCGVLLSTGGEYSVIERNRFYRIPSAVRLTDGANTQVVHNVIMQLNGGSTTLQTDRAGIYAAFGVNNGGKITIAHNKINHNETGLVPIILKGDAGYPQNAYLVEGNDMLQNGAAPLDYQILLYDAPSTRIIGNSIRSKGVDTAMVQLNSSANVVVMGNYFRKGSHALKTAASPGVQWAANVCELQGTGKLDGAVVNRNGRAFALKIQSTGTAGVPWDDAAWTVAKIAVGHYQVTHTIGATDYTVTVTTDFTDTAPERRISTVRGATTLDIYATDGAGAAVDEQLNVQVVVGASSAYAL